MEVVESKIYAELNEIFQELLAEDDISLRPETTAADVEGWDSMMNLNLMVAVETRFRIKMTTQEIEKLKNVGDLVGLILTKTS